MLRRVLKVLNHYPIMLARIYGIKTSEIEEHSKTCHKEHATGDTALSDPSVVKCISATKAAADFPFVAVVKISDDSQ